MFSRDRFSLSRFSLGSQDNSLPIEVTFIEEMKSVAGIAIPVPTTAFFNDVIRGTLRGAIAMKSSFEAVEYLRNSCKMNANINLAFTVGEVLFAAANGSQNKNIIAALTDELQKIVYAGKNISGSGSFSDTLISAITGVKNIQLSQVVNEVLTSSMDAGSQTMETVRIDITLPPGSEIRIDSDTYRVLLDGNNILYAQSGDWLTLARELLYVDVESASGGTLEGLMIYTERYL